MISYEDTDSIHAKVHYIKKHNLGGIMMWELSQDTNDETSLLKTIFEALSESKNP